MKNKKAPRDGSVLKTKDGFIFYNYLQNKWRTYPDGYLLGEFDEREPTEWELTLLPCPVKNDDHFSDNHYNGNQNNGNKEG